MNEPKKLSEILDDLDLTTMTTKPAPKPQTKK